jgi:hypothetical protein
VTLITIGLDLFAVQKVALLDPNAAFLQIGDESVRVVNKTRFDVVQWIEVAISAIAYLLITAASFRAVSQLYLGGEAEAGESLRFALGRILPLLWLSILLVLGIVVGLLFFIIPGIFLLVAWSVSIPVLMIEDARGSKAIGRSQRLVDKNWWRTFGALLVGFIFIGLFQFLLGLLASLTDGIAKDHLELWVLAVDAIQAIATIITAPLQAAIITVIYFNLRVRKEGFDLALLAQGIEGQPVPPPEQPVPSAQQPSGAQSPPESVPPPA